jgi:hypothetical protein
MEITMATTNRRSNPIRETTHESAPAARISPILQLRRSVMSCMLWENTFYEDGVSISERITKLVGECKPTEVATAAIEAKRDMRLRHVPLFMTRELMRTPEGRAQLEHVIPHVINRVDDITEILSMYFKDNKKKPRDPAKLPNQLKKHLGLALRKFDEYQFGKYKGDGKTVSLKDAIRIIHPVAENEEGSALFKRILTDSLKTPDTWEVAISGAKTKEDKTAQWGRLVKEKKLGGLAMLRNLRNLRESGIEDDVIKQGIKGIKAGRLVPINFIAAAKHNPQFEPQIEEKFFECFEKKADMPGKTNILIDVSGSMDSGQISGKSELCAIDVACALAMIARELFNDVNIFTFSNNIVQIPARRGFGLRDAIINSQPHGGTRLGEAVRQMPRNERLIVITDEQSHDPVEQRKGYMINVASNKNGVGYGQWVHVDGWSDKILDYVVKYEQEILK